MEWMVAEVKEFMMEDTKRNGLLEAAIRQATEKLVEKGVEGCTTKDVILASFASLSINDGGVATSAEVRSVATEIKRFGWRVVGACLSTLLAIVMVLIFL